MLEGARTGIFHCCSEVVLFIDVMVNWKETQNIAEWGGVLWFAATMKAAGHYLGRDECSFWVMLEMCL